MFKLEPNPTFTTFVSGFVPGGTPRDGLQVEFRYKTPEEFAAWLETFKTRTLGDVLLDIIETWRDAPVEFSREAVVEIAAKYPAFLSCLLETYRAELFEAKRKN